MTPSPGDTRPTGTSDHITRTAAMLLREALTLHGGQWRRVVSESMYPVIGIGDWIHVEAVDPPGIRCGDIVLFYRPDGLVVHRVVGIDRSGRHITEKGDASTGTGTVSFDDVIGLVTKVRRGGIVHDVRSGRTRLGGGFPAWRSRMRGWWQQHGRPVKTGFAERLPHGVRSILHALRWAPVSLLSAIRRSGDAAWLDVTERVAVGDDIVDVSIAPDNRDMSRILDAMRSHDCGHAVLSLYTRGVSPALVRFLAVSEFHALLYDTGGRLLDSIGDTVHLPDDRTGGVASVLIIPREAWEGMEASGTDAGTGRLAFSV